MPKPQYTKRQGEYLAFISQYKMLMEVSPSEGDIAAYFEVAGSSAHQMVVTLEKKGALRRVGGVARSIHLLVDSADLPIIGWPGSRFRHQKEKSSLPSIVAMLEFADYLAHRICAGQAMALAKIGSVSRLADRVNFALGSLAAPEELTKLIREYLMAMPWGSEKKAATLKRSDHSSEKHKERDVRKASRLRHVQKLNPNQDTLFGGRE